MKSNETQFKHLTYLYLTMNLLIQTSFKISSGASLFNYSYAWKDAA